MNTIVKLLGGAIITGGILIYTAPTDDTLRTQLQSDIASQKPWLLGNLVGTVTSQFVPFKTHDLGIVKIAQVESNTGPCYLGILGRWIHIV